MMMWGFLALLPFSVSALLALAGIDLAILATAIGFIGFAGLVFVSQCNRRSWKTYRQRQIVVDQNVLEENLEKGFRVVTVLSNGKVVIELS